MITLNNNPQYRNVGNLGDILKHAALINLLKLLACHNKSGLAYIESHAFLLNAPCPNPDQWLKEVNKQLSLYQSYRDYLDAEQSIMHSKHYRCSSGLAIDTLKEMGISNPFIILSEKNYDTRTAVKQWASRMSCIA